MNHPGCSAAKDDSKLVDPFGRSIDYLRLSVTDKCNLRCFYCLPKGFKGFEEHENCLSYEEIEKVVAAFAQLGVKRVRLTGGEPLARSNLTRLAAMISNLEGVEDLSLSTNASLLAKYAGDLKEAGVSRINVSLDTLDRKRFTEITGGHLEPVLEGLEAAREAGLAPIKINTVALKGLNDDGYGDMIEYCQERGFALRFIESMPVGSTGRLAEQFYLDLNEVRKDLATRYNLVPDVMPGGGPARYFRVDGTDMKIGFITPISQHFCETCNRVRLSVDGTLYLCLGQDHSVELRPLLRAGASIEDIKDAIGEAIKLKPEKHEFNQKPGQVVRFMSMTGG